MSYVVLVISYFGFLSVFLPSSELYILLFFIHGDVFWTLTFSDDILNVSNCFQIC